MTKLSHLIYWIVIMWLLFIGILNDGLYQTEKENYQNCMQHIAVNQGVK